ncbi:hypothetical protein PLICRDRAFT_180800 [Plicaturopsis crispa FD-325 SS-3]|uniref:Uncharacterized protein n=1 Tax=Plicaturopsis crispa FD-325 SS-3 TaxID=944288 RepID=A0A0C9T4J5_PLICR|nr:hypothetical protein PLICRDRAFT_180800 [Plicaturopsis crispa FD-325 SS-3]
MASVFTRAASRRLPTFVHAKRCIHSTPAVWARKVGQDELFVSRHHEEEVPEITAKVKKLATHPPRNERFSRGPGGRRVLRPEVRRARFDHLIDHVKERTGRSPEKPPIVRDTVWNHLFDLAENAEALERVVELFPRWTDTGRAFKDVHAEQFVKRCEELHCPLLALKVFGDHSKYGFPLKSLRAAQHLLHSLHVEQPLENTVAASALYGVYGLPPLATDPLSTALLLRACYAHKPRPTKHAKVVARSLLPQLQATLKAIPSRPIPTSRAERAKQEVKTQLWLKWSLTRVIKPLKKDGQKVDWLEDWLAQGARSAPEAPSAAV